MMHFNSQNVADVNAVLHCKFSRYKHTFVPLSIMLQLKVCHNNNVLLLCIRISDVHAMYGCDIQDDV